MKKDQLKKIVGFRVRLVPIANRLNDHGLPLTKIDDHWIVRDVTDEGIDLHLPRTGHCRILGFDNVHQFNTDRIDGGVTYGILVLNVQLTISRNDVSLAPTRPGEPVVPTIPPDPIRVALLHQLYADPTAHIPAGAMSQFAHKDVIAEITRCKAEGLIDAALLQGGNSVLDAVALRLKSHGIEWLRLNGF